MKKGIFLFILLLLIGGAIALWLTDHQTSAGSLIVTLGFLSLVIKYYWSGIKDDRFLYRIGEGEVVAISTGVNGTVDYYVVARTTWEKIWEQLNKAYDYFDRVVDPDDKEAGLKRIAELAVFLNTKVQVAGGFLKIFNFFILSFWNRAKTLKNIDSGVSGRKTHFPFVRSITTEFAGVEISGSGGAGTVAIKVTFQIKYFLFVDFYRIFNEQEPSETQIGTQVRNALSLFIAGIDPDKLEDRVFDDRHVAKAALHLLQFGIIGIELSIPDYDLEEDEAFAEAKRNQALAQEKIKTTKSEAEALAAKAKGEARAVKIKAEADAAAFQKKVEALKGVKPDVARLLLAPDNPNAAIPTGANIYTLARGGPEVWVDAEPKKDDKKGGKK